MASSTEMILGLTVLALLSLQAFGQTCASNKDCQKTHPCKVGFPLCADGKCTCSDANAGVVPDETCASNADCQKAHPCKVGFPLCADGTCICSDVEAVVTPNCSTNNDCRLFCQGRGTALCLQGKCSCI